MKKRALLIVDGIRGKTQVKRDLNGSKFPVSQYDKIVRAKTEEIFDEGIPWWAKLIPFGFTNWYDQYLNDIRLFFKNKMARIAVCKEVRSNIELLQADGYSVDVLSYSLGTIITLCCASQDKSKLVKIDNHFMYNSPLGFALPYLGWRVRKFTKKYNKNFLAGPTECVYGTKDIVSKDCKKKAKDIIVGRSTSIVNFIPTNTGHDLVDTIAARY